MPGLISCAGVTGSGCITYHAYATLLSGLKMSPETQQPPGSVLLSADPHTCTPSDDKDVVSYPDYRGLCTDMHIHLYLCRSLGLEEIAISVRALIQFN